MAYGRVQGQCRLAVLVKGVHVITVTVDTMYKFRTSTAGLNKICSEKSQEFLEESSSLGMRLK